MNIRQAQDSDKKQWDEYVTNHPESTPYHLTAWTTAVCNAYGFESINLIAEEHNHIVGIFPMSLLKIPLKQPTLVALPYCDIGNILADSISTQKALLESALSIAKNKNVSALDIRGEISQDVRARQNNPAQPGNNKVRMLLDLPDSAEELLSGFKSKLRSQIKKAEKNGLTFQLSEDNIEDFYSVFTLNMRDLGSPVHSKKWFIEIIKEYKNSAKIGLVYHENKAIGAGIILRVGNKISIPWASTLREYNRLSPNMLLYWNLLEYAADHQCQTFDFGRSTPDEGTYKFKAQWGAAPHPLPWHTILPNGKSEQTKPASGNNRALAEKIWQKLPLSLANFLGPQIRKHISL